MPLPLWKEGELENKPPHQQRDFYIGGQEGQAEPFPELTDYEKREHFRDYYAEIELVDDQIWPINGLSGQRAEKEKIQ